MTFVKRVRTIDKHINGTIPWQNIVIEDYFFHIEAQITIVREFHVIKERDRKIGQWVRWTCPEFGGGYAGLSYWLYIARHCPSHQNKVWNIKEK